MAYLSPFLAEISSKFSVNVPNLMKSWGGWVLSQDWVNCPKFTRFSMASLNHDQIVHSNHIFYFVISLGINLFNVQQSWNLMKVSQSQKLLQTLWSSFQSSASVDVCTAGRKEMEHWCSLLTISLCYTAVHPPQETGNAKSNYFCLNFFNCSSWYLLHITLMLLVYRMVEYITETNIESQFFE